MPRRFRPRLEPVESRITPAFANALSGLPPGAVLTPSASDPGLFRVIAAADGSDLGSVRPFPDGFAGEVRSATDDVTGNGFVDLIVAAGPGGGSRVRVFDGQTEAVVADFFAFEPDFRGGVYVAAGDVNRDGVADIVTGADEGGGPRVRVFDGRTGGVLADFFAFEESFRGGVRVATGDMDADGAADVIVAAGPGGAPRVVVYRVEPAVVMLDSYLAYEPDFRGGVYVTATGNGTYLLGPDNTYPVGYSAGVVTAPGAGGGPVVRLIAGEYSRTFVVGDAASRTGVRLPGRNLLGFVTETPTAAGPVLRAYQPQETWTLPPRTERVSGFVHAVDPAAGTITLQTFTGATRVLTVRPATGSVRFPEAEEWLSRPGPNNQIPAAFRPYDQIAAALDTDGVVIGIEFTRTPYRYF